MKHFSIRLSLFFFLLACSLSAFSQSFLSTNGKAIVNQSGDTVLLRGMGLGGWMLQEGYMLQTAGFASAQYQIRDHIEQLIGKADTDAFYDAWLANHVRKIDIDSLAAWGFNSVRLPMHYNLFTLPIEDEPVPGQNTWLTKGFELTDSLISWCRQNQMYVILDLHAAPGGQGYDQGISDYDPSKPSLWESVDNRNKTVALWKRLATRYANEPIIAGYDLLNEVNWNMNGNAALRALYRQITDSIRSVDTKHIIFIEGNWFANDFTGLTPPWDNNMVYSPHKYWSHNDKGSIQWVLDLREDHNIPLYLGESGENSNVWFRDAIALLEGEGIGWAWWPMKKVESIAGPLSVVKTRPYQTLLDYWNGSGAMPSAATAKATLMDLTDKLKLENCFYQKDVIDAMIRQVYSDETVPYKVQTIPGVVFATNYDMGRSGSAYFDTQNADYHVSTGNYTAWNNGWSYRNDGVDIERISDNINNNGYNIGWIDKGEWLQYEVDVMASAVYEMHVRIATAGSDGRLRFSVDGSDITNVRYVPNTGSFQNWQDMVIPNVILTPDDKKLRFHSEGSGFNVSSFNFIQKGATSTIPADYVSARTLDDQSIQLFINKPLAGPLPTSPADFEIFVNGNSVSITQTTLDTDNKKIIRFDVGPKLKSSDEIKISYSGTQIDAQDGTTLDMFSQKIVQNTIPIISRIPGRVEAEDFFFQLGVGIENTSDIGGGKNIGHLDEEDYLDYYVNVNRSGIYNVDIRTAAETETGEVQLQLIDANGGVKFLRNVSFPPTGGWQDWGTTSAAVLLPRGQQHLRVVIRKGQFNMNWMEFDFLTSISDPTDLVSLSLYPNPNNGLFTLTGTFSQPQTLQLQVYNMLGQSLMAAKLTGIKELSREIDLRAFPNGNYMVAIQTEDGRVWTKKAVKID